MTQQAFLNGLSAACLVCQENRPEAFRIYFDGYIKLYRCLRCGFVAQYPGPGRARVVEDYDHYYDLDFVKRGQKYMYPTRQAAFVEMAERIKRRVGAGAAILDIGAGDGHFMSCLEQAGFRAIGVEPSVALANYATTQVRGVIKNSYYERNLFSPESFDAITFIQVLEHVANPAEILRTAWYHLRPGGYVIVEVPSVHSPHFLAYRLTHLKQFVRPPTGVIQCHISYFSPKTLRQLARTAGFSAEELVTGRWKVKYRGLIKLIATITDPIFNALRIGGIFYIGRK